MYKVPSNVEKASKALCSSIIESLGGAAAVAKTLKWTRQYVHKQQKYYGSVPTRKVYDVSKLLEVSIWALAYHKLLAIVGPEESPTFKQVLKDVRGLLPGEKTRIMDIYLKPSAKK